MGTATCTAWWHHAHDSLFCDAASPCCVTEVLCHEDKFNISFRLEFFLYIPSRVACTIPRIWQTADGLSSGDAARHTPLGNWQHASPWAIRWGLILSGVAFFSPHTPGLTRASYCVLRVVFTSMLYLSFSTADTHNLVSGISWPEPRLFAVI